MTTISSASCQLFTLCEPRRVHITVKTYFDEWSFDGAAMPTREGPFAARSAPDFEIPSISLFSDLGYRCSLPMSEKSSVAELTEKRAPPPARPSFLEPARALATF
jgi:hypothetical protein